MSAEELAKQTAVNVQEKANLIWAIADKIVGVYKPHEYGNVILPMCVIKRFNDVLAATKQAVLDMNAQLDERGIIVKDGFLKKAAGYDFYNTSRFTLEGLLSDPENIADNLRSYLNHFSPNVIDIIENFDFDKEISKMDDNGVLYNVVQEFSGKKAYMGLDAVTAVDMGYIFEELVRKFSESYDEHAGAHFTARDIIYLMAELLVAPDRERMRREGVTTTIYDMAMGTSQMLDCLSEKLIEIDPTYGRAWTSLGTCYYQIAMENKNNIPECKKWLNEAIPCYKKSEEVEPDNPILWGNYLYRCYHALSDKANEQKYAKYKDA